MNDPGAPPPDWDSIFRQARRRMAGKLLLVALIAAGGTMLLLGGGLQAEGAVSLPIPILSANHHKDKQQEQKHPKHRRHHEKEHHEHHEKQDDHEKHRHHKHHPKPCKEEQKTSAEEEYGRWDGGKGATGGKCPKVEGQ